MPRIDEALEWMAGQLNQGPEQFATGIVMAIDTDTGMCQYVNAGHPSGLVVRADGTEALDPTGPIVGADGGTWRTGEIQLHDEDLVVLFTDGMLDARLPDGSFFPEQTLLALAQASRRRDEASSNGRPSPTPLAPDPLPAAQAVADALVDAVHDACGTSLRDDATVVVVRFGERKPAPAAPDGAPQIPEGARDGVSSPVSHR